MITKTLTTEEKATFDKARRWSQAIKLLSERFDTFKDYQKQTHPETEFVYDGRKLASVKQQDGKPVFDLEGFIKANPKMAAQVLKFTKKGKATVFRFH